MYNAFPYILSWSMLAPLLIRLVVGAHFVAWGYNGLTSEWRDRQHFFEINRIRPSALFATGTATIDIVAGMLLMMGYATQIVALALAVVCLTAIVVKLQGENFPYPSSHTYALVFVMLVSLFLTGAGYFAMDLPV